MAMNEFELIKKYFKRSPTADAVLLGVGDDAALLRADGDWAVAADMMVAGRHFLVDDAPASIGHKLLAVNLSDMAAMGAQPVAATLCLALPEINADWLQAFADGFWTLARRYGVDLIGGDTTRGPLTLAIQIWGRCPAASALRRDGAQVGDDIWVSGQIGSAALGLQHRLGQLALDPATSAACLQRLHWPQPRVALGLALRGLAHAAIDISDGLAADLRHVLQASAVGAELEWPLVPVLPYVAERRHLPALQQAVFAGGDDYELCFTAPPQRAAAIAALADTVGVTLTRVGRIMAGNEFIIKGDNGAPIRLEQFGFDHFSS